MNTEKSLVAFDCDGVLFDHIGEDFLCAYNALLALFPERSVPGLPGRHLDLEDITQVKHENILFTKFRSLARFALRAEDYYTVFELALHGDSDLASIGETDFQEARRNHIQVHPQFREEFYRARSMLQEEAPQKWAEIVPIFPGVFEAISGLASRPGTIVATATGRDRASTVRLLVHNRIDEIIQEIASRESGNTKLEQLKYLSELTDVPLGHMIFVDDKLSNLFEVIEDCIPVLADWGLTSPQDIERGRRAGLNVLRLPSLYRQVDSLLNRLTIPQHTENE